MVMGTQVENNDNANVSLTLCNQSSQNSEYHLQYFHRSIWKIIQKLKVFR